MEQMLIQKIKGGDDGAFAELYQLYAEYSLRVATAITKNSATAGDAVQETFIRIYKNIESFDVDKPFKPWFNKILVNECNRILKERSKTIFISDTIEENRDIAVEDLYEIENHEELYQAIQNLPDINRIPIILKYMDDMPEKEIADNLGVNLNTLKSRLLKGRQKLKDMLVNWQLSGGV